MSQTMRAGRSRRAAGLIGALALVSTVLGVLSTPAHAAPGWTVSPTPMSFGNVRVGNIPPPDILTITNNTGSSQTIKSVKTEGGNAPQDFGAITGVDRSFNPDPNNDCLFLANHTPRTLANGESCTFVVLAQATQVGTRSTSLVARDAANVEMWTAPLNVTGTLGYYLAGAAGEVKNFGDAPPHGDATKFRLNGPIVDAQQVPFQDGYWLLGKDGGVFSFGPDAKFYGSTGGMKLNAPVVAMAPLFNDEGYLFAASDGGVFVFSPRPAHFRGSMGGKPLNAPIVGIANLPNGEDGYFLVASDGGVFAFGGAANHFKGSMGGKHLNAPIIGILPMFDGDGYFLVASDGGVFAFGSAANHFKGSMGGTQLQAPITDLASRPDGDGYWMAAQDGGLFSFNVPFYGNLVQQKVNDVVSMFGTAAPTDPAGLGGTAFSVNDPLFATSMGAGAGYQKMFTKAKFVRSMSARKQS
jgi:hypothetical protein